MRCVSCLTPIPEASSACPFCGTAVVDPAAATLDSRSGNAATPVRASRPSRPISSSSSVDGSRFVPGAMLLERYRVVGLLGRGGMGEVYRAEDLKLAQVVALKFLPPGIAADAAALARFHREVRIARQVSHPNVCRVFDIGEVDGQVFLSMEYIDGEDLGSLLRRIGRLPADKALELARQLCAGLAAAHEMGVLHRDLKPANVMIDGRGKARITDFGLAVLGDELHAGEARAGTPGYMAPEQMAGKGASIRSDIYSLGLVFYELFTGKRAFEANSIAELLRKQEESAITHPSSLVQDINPVVERVILRCLEKEPRSRPASALQVALALPGGDPLAAALAAGETPSPEMVAAAGETEGLRPAVAWSCVALLVAAIAFALWPDSPVQLIRQVPLEKSPAVLAERAQSIVRDLGYSDTPADTAQDFYADSDFLRYIASREPTRSRWKHEIGPINYYFRGSPQPLYTYDFFNFISEEVPPLSDAGATMLRLSPKGRLLKLIIVPPQVGKTDKGDAPPAVDWSALFRESGFDAAHWVAAAPEWTPPTYADARAAWTGAVEEFPGTPMRIEAAAYRGRPVYFELIAPWTRAARMQPYQQTAGEKVVQGFLILLLLLLLVGGALLARRNLRLGRGDRRGAWRLASFMFAVSMFGALVGRYHVSDSSEIGIIVERLSFALFVAVFLWMLYLALEPLVRRRWPKTLVSWSRLLAGEFRDPLVGRDVLFGVAAAALLRFTDIVWLAGYWKGRVPDFPPILPFPQMLLGGRFELGQIAGNVMSNTFFGLAVLFVLFLLRLLLRRDWLVVAGMAVVFPLVLSAQSNFAVVDVVSGVLGWLLIAVVALRCGLLAVVVTFLVSNLLSLPLTPDPSAWYFGVGVVALLAVSALTGFAFYTSLGGKSAFGGLKLEEG
ncbi:MAG: protein kinase domain-containing protein [Terriglobales bacterium]